MFEFVPDSETDFSGIPVTDSMSEKQQKSFCFNQKNHNFSKKPARFMNDSG